MKYFRMSYEEVVFNRSYINILLLNRSIPSYDFDNDDDEDSNDTFKSNNKRSFTKSKQKFNNEAELFMSLM